MTDCSDPASSTDTGQRAAPTGVGAALGGRLLVVGSDAERIAESDRPPTTLRPLRGYGLRPTGQPHHPQLLNLAFPILHHGLDEFWIVVHLSAFASDSDSGEGTARTPSPNRCRCLGTGPYMPKSPGRFRLGGVENALVAGERHRLGAGSHTELSQDGRYVVIHRPAR